MRVILIVALALSVACGAPGDSSRPTAAAARPVAPAVGDPAPEFEFVDIDGAEGRLSEYRGRIVLLFVWASWCPHCRGEMPSLVEAYRRYHDGGFEILGIASGEKLAAVRAYDEQHAARWRQTIEADGGPIATLYGADFVPMLVLIDRDGTIVAHDFGGSELDALLAGLIEDTHE